MLELTPEPWPLIAFNGTDPESTLCAFRSLGGALDVLVAARRVLDLVPGWEPISREGQAPTMTKTTHFGSNRNLGLIQSGPSVLGWPGSLRHRA